MTVTVALLDANVLYPAPLRDLLMQLAVDGLYQARWSADIDDEWMRNLRAARPELTVQIERTRAIMHRAIPDALVTGYETQISALSLPDPDDRHVLAAAIATSGDVIVTFNLKDFPPMVLAAYEIEAQHPDVFVKSLADSFPLRVLAGVRACLARLTNRSITADGYLTTMRRLGLTEVAEFLTSNRAGWLP